MDWQHLAAVILGFAWFCYAVWWIWYATRPPKKQPPLKWVDLEPFEKERKHLHDSFHK